jgi:hypothetical protein
VQARAPAKVPEHRLRLILGVMGQKHEGCSVPRHHALKEGVALRPCAGLDGEPASPGEGGNPGGMKLELEAKLSGETPDERGVLSRLMASQPVIEVTNDESFPAVRHQKVEERH